MKSSYKYSLLCSAALAGAFILNPAPASASALSDFSDSIYGWFVPAPVDAPADAPADSSAEKPAASEAAPTPLISNAPVAAPAAEPAEPQKSVYEQLLDEKNAETEKAIVAPAETPADAPAGGEVFDLTPAPAATAPAAAMPVVVPAPAVAPAAVVAPAPAANPTVKYLQVPAGVVPTAAAPAAAAPAVAPAPEKTAEKPAEKAAAPAPDVVVQKSIYEKLLDEKVAAEPPSPSGPTPADDDLKAALEHVYATHPQIQAQRESLKAVDENVSQAIAGFRPTAEADMSKGRQRTGDANSVWEYQNERTEALTITQPIFNGGETLANLASAKDRVRAGRAQLSALEQQVLYNAVVAYTDVVEKQSVLEENQKNVDDLKQQLDATQARFNVGELTVTDVAQSNSRLANAQALERQALGDLEASKSTFRHAVGFDVPEKVGMPSVPQNLPASISEANAWAQAENPTLEAAKQLQSAAEHDVNARAGEILPSVNVQGSMLRSNGTTTSIDHLDSDELTVNLSIPLYQSGAEWSRVRQARNTAQQAKFAMLDANQSVVEDVSRAWEDYQTAKAVITSNEEAVKAAEVALDGVRKENEFGVRTVLDVLDAEREAFTAHVNLTIAIRAEKVQAYRLLASVGKLTAKELNLKTDVPSPKEHYDNVKYQLIGL